MQPRSTYLTEQEEVHGCLVRYSPDHRKAQVVFPRGRPMDFASCKNFTAKYKALQEASRWAAKETKTGT